MDHLCYLCLVFVCSLLPVSPAGKGLNSWLSFVTFNCVFVSFPCGILGLVWYLKVSIPDLCHLSYFHVCKNLKRKKNTPWVTLKPNTER